MTMCDATHDPALRSWVESANVPGTDFPVQNLPFGRFRPMAAGESVGELFREPAREPIREPFRIGVAIGDQVLDLQAVHLLDHADMNLLMAATPEERRLLRSALSEGLAVGSPKESTWELALYRQDAVELSVPCRIGDYTDFYSGIHHAAAVGRLFRPDAPLMPNYKWVPVGYHGRASSIRVSGHPVVRPCGQSKTTPDGEPVLGASQRLDHELELGFFIGTGNALGEPIPVDEAEAHLFGVCLLNDWSARDVQTWEYQPLGPFLAKSFATTVSPWIVTTEALAPFRAPFVRDAGDPAPLPYLDAQAMRDHGAFDIALEVWLQTPAMRAAGEAAVRLSQSNAAEAMYWTAAQLIAHHTVGGCNLQPGDLLGSGTLSGARPGQAGSMLELSEGGQHPLTLPNGEQRRFLGDGDTLTLRARCEREGAVTIGFGDCTGTVLPARLPAGR